MSDDAPVAVSPLVAAGTGTVVDGWEWPVAADGAGEVTVVDLCPWAKVQVRGDEAARLLDVDFGRVARREDRLVVGSGPGEWMVLAAPGRGPEVVAELSEALGSSFATVVDQTHGRALVRVRGPETLALLRRVMAMDLDDRFVPPGAAFRTTVANVVTDVVREDHPDEPSYLLHCERSSGRYLADTLTEVGADLGARLVGEPGARP